MDSEILKEALGQMKGEMRSRVGKKILSIEVIAHDDDGAADEDENGAAPVKEKDDEDGKSKMLGGIKF